jgi:hypothetical protein
MLPSAAAFVFGAKEEEWEGWAASQVTVQSRAFARDGTKEMATARHWHADCEPRPGPGIPSRTAPRKLPTYIPDTSVDSPTSRRHTCRGERGEGEGPGRQAFSSTRQVVGHCQWYCVAWVITSLELLRCKPCTSSGH